MDNDNHQLTLTLSGDDQPRMVKTTRRANKRRVSLPVVKQPELIDEPTFGKPGVPKTRGDCPVERPCPHLKCKYNLFLEDAEHRAGRPGLANVPRDSRGRTVRVAGDAGGERPGTTARPGWLKYRSLEVERECKVYLAGDGTLLNVRGGALEYWLEHLHMGEPVLVFDDCTSQVVAKAKLTADGLALDRQLPEHLMNSSSALVLMRVREVSSCALDEIDRIGRLSNEQTGNAIGRHRTLVARVVRGALVKAVAEAKRRGMDRSDFLEALAGLGSGSR